MAYIWINPVADSMYETDILNKFLRQHGYKRIDVSADWPAIVKEKYQLAVERAPYTVMDMRCPKIKEMLEELSITSGVTIPEIHPILIHCAWEISRREDLRGEEKVITTPCSVLADMGNALGLQDTWFVSWNRFVKSIGGKLPDIELGKSPIPPGFFTDLKIKTVSATGEEAIRDYLRNGISEDVQLAELLFCKEGCHNGDGIRMCDV